MKRIAILGPKGTFTDKACEKYLTKHQFNYQKMYFTTFDQVFYALNNKCNIGIIPIENTLDGYVQRTLDLLFETKAEIIEELQIPIQFSLIGNVDSIEEIKKLYVQFKANGQCRQFINSLGSIEISSTETNMETYYKAEHGFAGEAGIISNHMLSHSTCSFHIDNVTDLENNYTRFLVIKPHQKEVKIDNSFQKMMMYVTCLKNQNDFVFVLNNLCQNHVQIISVSSQPTRMAMGTYHYAIELEGSDLKDIMTDLNKYHDKFDIHISGVYKKDIMTTA